MAKKKIKLCPTCKKNPANEPNTCPYDEEFKDKGKRLEECTCCDDCRQECVYNI